MAIDLLPMNRLRQFLLIVSVLALSWYGMMAVHELGHVAGAKLTGGTIVTVVLHPLTISRTDVSPNPHPAIVVWLGPVIGIVLPLVVFLLVPRRNVYARNLARFFASFCFIANGAYISFGSFDRVGDCGEMLRTGTPFWVMIAFGAATIPIGLYLWHRLGSVKNFLGKPNLVTWRATLAIAISLVVVIAVELLISPK